MSNFEEKEAWFAEQTKSNYWKFKSASASEFYRDLFPAGSFENRVGHKDNYEKTNKGNGFIVYTVGEKKHTRIVFDDLAELFDPPLKKSGLNHRFAKLAEEANKMRAYRSEEFRL